MHQRHMTARRSWPVLAGGFVLAAVAAGCAAGSASPSAGAVLGPIPFPTLARLEVGQSGPGYDAGAALYGFTSSRTPAATLADYTLALEAVGYTASGQAAGWYAFRRGPILVTVHVGQEGPPTDLLVRVVMDPTSPSRTPAPATPAPATPGTANGANGPPSAPPGQATGSPNPSGPPDQAQPSPTPNGPDSRPSVPPGQAKPPPPHGGGPNSSGTSHP